jgi:uncharacterized protein YndB with AHSA1/START domain
MTATADNGWQLSVTRYIAAPPETVWQVMTERLSEWWCPRPWRTEIVELDWRAGGRCTTLMRGPDGEQSGGEGIFLEVTPGKRFVFTDAFAKLGGDFRPQAAFMVGGMEISADGSGTRYFAWSRHWDEATCKRHAEMGFAEGWNAVAGQLATLAEGGTID